MHTLVEAADQLEGSNSTEPGKEEERVVCPTCGEIFKEAGHKIVIHAYATQQFAPTIEGAAEKEDAITQEPASLNILVEVATNSGIEEPRDEIIPNSGDEDCTLTPECSRDTKIIEVEPQRQDNDEIEQGAVTQEPTSLSVLVQMVGQMGEELGIEGTLEFNK